MILDSKSQNDCQNRCKMIYGNLFKLFGSEIRKSKKIQSMPFLETLKVKYMVGNQICEQLQKSSTSDKI